MSVEDIKAQIRRMLNVEMRTRDVAGGVLIESACLTCQQVIVSRLLPLTTSEGEDARAGLQDARAAFDHMLSCWPEER